MDPNECLRQIRDLVRQVEMSANTGAPHFQLALELAERVTALDEWLTKGGFVPSAWWKVRLEPIRMDD